MKKEYFWRAVIYIAGLFCLAAGVTLATKTELGISPITSAAFAASGAFHISFPSAVFWSYAILVGLQFLMLGKHHRWRDLLQLPFSLVFSAVLSVMERIFAFQVTQLWMRFVLLALSIVVLSIGVCMMVTMQIVPNPADGTTQVLSWVLKKDLGFAKNIMDFLFVSIAFLLDIYAGHLWYSVGVGTVVTMIFNGRVVALFNHLFRDKILRLAGMSDQPQL